MSQNLKAQNTHNGVAAVQENRVEAETPNPADAARLVMATMYQTCDVLKLKPLSNMSSFPLMKGLKNGGKHSNGIGTIRKYSDTSDVAKKHYYLANTDVDTTKAGCVAVDSKPPIYNYGGKASLSSKGRLSVINPGGSGAKGVAGIDCSGLIVASLARAGLRVKKNDTRSWSTVGNNTNTSAMADPSGWGLSCLERVTLDKTPSPQAGDIISWRGHVVMVESASSDPFGLKKNPDIKNASDCTAGNLSTDDLDFRIIHSNPGGGGVGVNIMDAKSYFKGGNMLKMAVKACKAKFGVKSTAQAGSKNFSIVRHQSEKKECRTKPTKIENEECVNGCNTVDKKDA